MKRCPTCRREYPDDHQFCLEDATPLTASNMAVPVKTAAPTSMPTVGSPLRPVPLPLALGGLAAFLLLGTAVYRESHKTKASSLRVETDGSRVTKAVFPPADAATKTTVASTREITEEAAGDFSSPTPPLSADTIARVLSAHKTLAGEADDSRRHVQWPFRLRPTEFDAASGRMVGSLEWTTMGSIHRVEGTLTNHVLTFKETAFIRKGKAVLGPEYRLSENDEHNLTGTWQHANRGTGGHVWCMETEAEETQGGSTGIAPRIPEGNAITESDLVGKSRWDLVLMRNVPYARHGYRFHEAKIYNYFAQQPWYHPDTGDEDKVYRRLSSIEKRNVEVLKWYQKLRISR